MTKLQKIHPIFKAYIIYAEGKVYSIKSKKFLKQCDWGDRIKYPSVSIWHNKKGRLKKISHLVLETFVGKKPKNMAAAHLDGNVKNNSLTNLKWCTYKENESHKIIHGTKKYGSKSPVAKLTEKQVIKIREQFKITGLHKYGGIVTNVKALAKKYKVTETTIHFIIKGETWAHV